MGRDLDDLVRRAAGCTRNNAVNRRVVSPLARKVGGCATVLFIVLFTGLGVAAAIAVGRLGGDPDTVGPAVVGVGLLGGIILGALVGVAVRRLLVRLLIR